MDDDLSDGVSFTFRLADGSPLTMAAGSHYNRHYPQLFRELQARHGRVDLVKFDARPDEHPDVVAETADLRRKLHEARIASGWTPSGWIRKGGIPA